MMESAREGVQANQFLIVNGDNAMLLDLGSQLTYTALSLELKKLGNFDTKIIVSLSQES